MKIQCDVCEKAPATVICCADEAALCAKCDIEIHAANKLARKHHRLFLDSLSNKLPFCDICQEKPAFIFCVDDRALFCQDCDESIHVPGNLSANHQRFLATGIRVALSSSCTTNIENNSPESHNQNSHQPSVKVIEPQTSSFDSPWAVDDLLQFSDYEPPAKKGKVEFGEFEWLSDMGIFGEQLEHEGALEPAEVPQLPEWHLGPTSSSKTAPKFNAFQKKPRIAVLDDLADYFTVPDLG